MIGCVMFWMLSPRSLVSSDLADTPIPEVGDTEQDRIKEKAPLVWERSFSVWSSNYAPPLDGHCRAISPRFVFCRHVDFGFSWPAAASTSVLPSFLRSGFTAPSASHASCDLGSGDNAPSRNRFSLADGMGSHQLSWINLLRLDRRVRRRDAYSNH